MLSKSGAWVILELVLKKSFLIEVSILDPLSVMRGWNPSGEITQMKI